MILFDCDLWFGLGDTQQPVKYWLEVWQEYVVTFLFDFFELLLILNSCGLEVEFYLVFAQNHDQTIENHKIMYEIKWLEKRQSLVSHLSNPPQMLFLLDSKTGTAMDLTAPVHNGWSVSISGQILAFHKQTHARVTTLSSVRSKVTPFFLSTKFVCGTPNSSQVLTTVLEHTVGCPIKKNNHCNSPFRAGDVRPSLWHISCIHQLRCQNDQQHCWHHSPTLGTSHLPPKFRYSTKNECQALEQEQSSFVLGFVGEKWRWKSAKQNRVGIEADTTNGIQGVLCLRVEEGSSSQSVATYRELWHHSLQITSFQ